jgi:hypothetical protein
MKLTTIALANCTRTDKLGCAGASNVRSLNRFARGSLGRFVCRSSGGLLHESTHVEHDVPFSPPSSTTGNAFGSTFAPMGQGIR